MTSSVRLTACPPSVPDLPFTKVTMTFTVNGCLVILICPLGFYFVEGGTWRSLVDVADFERWPKCRGNCYKNCVFIKLMMNRIRFICCGNQGNLNTIIYISSLDNSLQFYWKMCRLCRVFKGVPRIMHVVIRYNQNSIVTISKVRHLPHGNYAWPTLLHVHLTSLVGKKLLKICWYIIKINTSS